MSWRDTMGPASFRGVPFFVDTSELSGGRRGVTHEYPFRDKPFREDTGQAARTFMVEGYILGPDYFLQRDALIAAFQDPGTGTLVHPYHGTRSVAVDKFNISERRQDGGICYVSVSFIETPAQPAQPTVSPDTAGRLTTTASSARGAVGDEFLERYAPGLRMETVEDMPRRLTVAISQALATVDQKAQRAAALQRQLDELASAGAALVHEPDDVLAAVSELFDALTSRAVVTASYAFNPGVRPPDATKRAFGTVTLAGVGGTAASGTITFETASGAWTVTVNGVIFGDTATGVDATDAENLYLMIFDSVDPLIVGVVEPTWDGISGTVTITAVEKGEDGNALTLAFTGTGVTGSGAMLAGGVDGEITVTVDGTEVVTDTTDMTDADAASAVVASLEADETLGDVLTAEADGDVVELGWDEPGTAGNVELSAASVTGTATASGATLTGGLDITPNRRVEQENFDALREVTQRLAVVRAAELAVEETFESYEQAVSVRDELLTLLDEQAETADDGAYPALLDLRAALVDALPGVDSDLPRLLPYTPVESVPSLVLSWELYGNVTGEADIVTRNRVKHPAFLLGGVALEVLSEA